MSKFKHHSRRKIRIPKEKLIVRKQNKSKKGIFNNLNIVNSGHNDSLLNYESATSPKVFRSRKASHKMVISPIKSPVNRRAIVSHFTSPKNRKVVVSIASTSNTSVRTKSKYTFNAFSKKRILELK
jgi:hypothetical protein